MKPESLTPKKLLSYLEGTFFQTFYDPDSTQGKAFCTPDYDPTKFKELNNQKYGIYFSANAFKDERKKEKIIKLNTIFGDLDVGKEGDGQTAENILIKKKAVFKALRELPIKPNIIIVTKNGLQPLFLIENPGLNEDIIQTYTNTICGLIDWSKNVGCLGDEVKDLARVLRLPGYFHQKSKPFMVEAYLLHEYKTTLSALSKQFPYFDEKKIANDNASKDGNFSELNHIPMQDVALAALKQYGEPDAYFDDKGRIWLKRGVTGAFLGKMGNCDYIGSLSHELPSGNKTTFVRRLLKLESNKEAFKWICKEFNLKLPLSDKKLAVPEDTLIKSSFTTPPSEMERVFEPILAKNVRTLTNIAVEWVVEGLLAKNYLTLFAAREKLGKTTLLKHLLKSLTSGADFLGLTAKKSKVLVISEEAAGIWNRRLEDTGLDNCDSLWFNFQPFNTKLKQKDWEKWLIQLVAPFCEKNGIETLIIDTLSPIWPVVDENDAGETNAALLPLVSITKKNVAVMAVHHNSKASEVRGSTAITAVPSILLQFSKPQGDEDTTRRVLKGRSRFEETLDQMLLDYENGEYVLLGTPQNVAKEEKLTQVKEILATFPSGAVIKEIIDAWGDKKPSRTTLKRWLDELCFTQSVYPAGMKEIEGGRAIIYSRYPNQSDNGEGISQKTDFVPIYPNHFDNGCNSKENGEGYERA